MPFQGLDLTGKTAVVIGGTSGIGRAIALGYVDAGANVIATSRRKEQVEAVAERKSRSAAGKQLGITSDVGERKSDRAIAVEPPIKKFGSVEILVNSAGTTKRAPTLDFSEEDWNQIVETNLTGTLRACQVFGRHMIERRYGRIINIASLSSFVSLMEVAAYSASKSAVASLTKSLAIEWAPYGVCVNAIAPGVFPTPLNQKLLDGSARGQEFILRTPMKRFGKVEELAGAAIFLASDSASFVTGEILCVDGGFLASGVNQ